MMVRHVRPTSIAFSSTTTFTTAATQVLLILLLAGASFAYPFTRGGLSRTVRGAPNNRLKSQDLDYLSELLRQASTQQQQQEPSTRYDLPEYRPSYMNQYYAQLKPRIDSETLAEILPYLSSAADRDYSDYDYSSYNDDDGTWYDSAASDPNFDDTTSAEDEALVQIFLDQLSKNKYSVDDLKALEREEQLQEEPENELHALMAKKINKKSNNMPSLGMHATPSDSTSAADRSPTGSSSSTVSHSTQQGQKEEALLVPATSMRRPIFSQQPMQLQNQLLPNEQQQQKAGSSSSSSGTSSTSSDKESSGCTEGDCSEDSTTMSPRIQSAYDTLKRYLDQERELRQSKDEGRRTPQKRFIPEQESLTQQLANLKKHVV